MELEVKIILYAPISEDLVERGRFIMLGRLSNCDEVTPNEILADFDRLLPLYKFVESGDAYQNNLEIPDFNPGCPNFVREFTTSEIESGIRNVSLRHATAQKLLYELLCEEVGCENVQIERPLGSVAWVDAATRLGEHEECFYEVKISNTVLSCVRSAIGQLLEYAYLYSQEDVQQLVVVGEAKAKDFEKEYLKVLRDTYGLPIYYRRIDIQNEKLEPQI